MCGIFGFVGDPERARAIDLDAAIRALRHRGPDGSGTFRDEQHDHSISCVFAHTRLAILDVTPAGAQPMSTSDGRLTLCYNGEVYNFRELRRELQGLGEEFLSDCDTEVVLKGFRRWGASVVERLRGIFAFVVWNRDRRSLFLARDRLGVKPLYYVHRPDGLAVASEVRTLLATGCAERRFSRGGLRSYFQYGSVSDPDTILEGVQSLLPGHRAEFRDGRLQVEPYWLFSESTVSDRSYEETVASMRSSLDQAVASELVSDVPLGVFLSGGIDSSAIVALASCGGSRPLQTFTVTFEEEPYNEAGYAAEIAARFGCDHHQVQVPAARAARDVEHVLSALDQPSADGVNTFVVAAAARQAGLSVALSGLGGDEIFAGYRHFRTFARLARARKLIAAVAGLVPDQRSGDPFNNQPHWIRKSFDLLEARGNPLRTYTALRSMFTPRQREALVGPNLGPTSGHDSAGFPNGNDDPVTLFSRFELTHYIRNTLLRDADAMSMAHSLEVRVPLLDHRLVEAAMAVPGTLKLSSTINKPLLVDAARLPRDVVRRPKMGFVLPLDVWFRGALKPLVSELLFGEPLRRLRFLDGAAVSSMWRGFLHGEKYVSHSRVWCLAALTGWAERNRVTL